MSRRLLATLSLMLVVLALGFVALQWIVLDPRSLEPGLPGLAESDQTLGWLSRAESLSDGWRRINGELGRLPPPVEGRNDR